jgi:hypothetical protein
MKVVLPKNNGFTKKKHCEEPVLPLEESEATETDKTKLVRFKLRTELGNAAGPTYDFHMAKINGSESVRKAIRFLSDCQKVFIGLDVTNVDTAARIYRELLEGEALNRFNGAVDTELERLTVAARQQAAQRVRAAGGTDDEIQAAYDGVAVLPATMDILKDGIRAVITYMAPSKALTRQKRWMRRFCRKPAGMSIRTFANHITRINNEELPMLPPFGPRRDQTLSQDELIDVVLNGIPRSWMKEMDKQGFDPVEKDLQEVIDFCERMENAEDFEPARDGNKTNSDNKVPRKDSSSKKSKSDGGKYCLLHGNNGSHNTDDCMVLKNQAKALRNNDGDRKPAYKNKTWKRDADKSTNSSKKELAAFVRKQTSKELYAFAKKRKASDDDDNKSLNAMEDGEVSDGSLDLSRFNYAKMSDLKIDSDDDDSISV